MSLIFQFSISKLGYKDIFMKICEKKVLTHFLGHFWLVEANMKMKMKKLKKMSLILEFAISKVGYVPVFMKVWEKNFWPIFKTFLTNQGKTEDENEKIWKNELNFLILHIKIRLYGNFYENMLKKVLTHFFRHFWLIEGKIKIKMKKYGKMSSIFEFSISKLRYIGIFKKVWEKTFWPIF